MFQVFTIVKCLKADLDSQFTFPTECKVDVFVFPIDFDVRQRTLQAASKFRQSF
jgi:hypothetical protein